MALSIAPDLGEQVVFVAASWQTYEALVAGMGDEGHTRLAFDGETLELMSPSSDHENYASLIDAMLTVVLLEWDLNLIGVGSMTLKAEPVGAEPDTSYYIASVARVEGFEKIDLRTSPPPDLVVEVDISRRRMDKFELYATLGVPEFWRYGRKGLEAFALSNGAYVEIGTSKVIPGLPMAVLASFLERRREDDRRVLLKDWQAWLRANRPA
jgi:Uma2 family endonuclease